MGLTFQANPVKGEMPRLGHSCLIAGMLAAQVGNCTTEPGKGGLENGRSHFVLCHYFTSRKGVWRHCTTCLSRPTGRGRGRGKPFYVSPSLWELACKALPLCFFQGPCTPAVGLVLSLWRHQAPARGLRISSGFLNFFT